MLARRADREAEGARLLSEYTPQGYLGFESPALRQFHSSELIFIFQHGVFKKLLIIFYIIKKRFFRCFEVLNYTFWRII